MLKTLGREINLLANFPKINRAELGRGEEKTEEDRRIARQFGKEFFDGPRRCGYGGYNYHPRFWQPVVKDFQKTYHLTKESKILDIGCAKGFLLYDLMQLIPGITVRGLDISSYAIENAPPEVKPFLTVGNAKKLPYEDHSFDLVLSLSTHHNLEGEDLSQGLKEMERVSKGNSFIFLDGYRSNEEKEQLHQWNLTARSIFHVDEWKSLFQRVGFTGDFYWFVP